MTLGILYNQLNNEYVGLIQEDEGIIHKVIGLYVDNAEDRKDLFQEILFLVKLQILLG